MVIRPRPSVGTTLLVAALACLVILSGYGVFVAFRMSGGSSMSFHGYVALGLAVVFTALLAGGLIVLAFYSARHGYDDNQGRED